MALGRNLASIRDRHVWELFTIRHYRLFFLITWKCRFPFINFDEGGWLSICDIRVWELVFELALSRGDNKPATNGRRTRSFLNSFGSSTGSSTSGRTGRGVGRRFVDGLLTTPAFWADALFPAKTVDALVATGKELGTL